MEASAPLLEASDRLLEASDRPGAARSSALPWEPSASPEDRLAVASHRPSDARDPREDGLLDHVPPEESPAVNRTDYRVRSQRGPDAVGRGSPGASDARRPRRCLGSTFSSG